MSKFSQLVRNCSLLYLLLCKDAAQASQGGFGMQPNATVFSGGMGLGYGYGGNTSHPPPGHGQGGGMGLGQPPLGYGYGAGPGVAPLVGGMGDYPAALSGPMTLGNAYGGAQMDFSPPFGPGIGSGSGGQYGGYNNPAGGFASPLRAGDPNHIPQHALLPPGYAHSSMMHQQVSGLVGQGIAELLKHFNRAGDPNLTPKQEQMRQGALSAVMTAQTAVVMGSSGQALQAGVMRLLMSPRSPESQSYLVTMLAVTAGTALLTSVGLAPVAAFLPGMIANVGLSQRGWFKKSYEGVGNAARGLVGKIGDIKAWSGRKISHYFYGGSVSREEQAVEEAVAKAAGQSNCSILFKSLARGEMTKVRDEIDRIRSPKDALDALDRSMAFQASVYLIIQRVFTLMKAAVPGFDRRMKNEIIKRIVSPLISPLMLIRVLTKAPFREFLPSVIEGILNLKPSPFFAEYYCALTNAFPHQVGEAVRRTAAFLGDKAALVCIFHKLSNPGLEESCKMMENFGEQLKDRTDNYNFAKTVNAAVGGARLNWLRKNESDLAALKKHRGQLAFAKYLVTHFTSALETLIDNGLIHCIDLILRVGDESAVNKLKSLRFHISHPRILARFLATVQPSSTIDIKLRGEKDQLQTLLDIYDHLQLYPLKLKPPRTVPVQLTAETCQAMLGSSEEKIQWDELDATIKLGILDLIVMVVYGVHPEKMPSLSPLYYEPFQVQLKSRLTHYAKMRMRTKEGYTGESHNWASERPGSAAASPSFSSTPTTSPGTPNSRGALERRYRPIEVIEQQTIMPS